MKKKNNIIINKEFKLNSSINIYTNIMPNIIGDCGLIFGFDNYNSDIDNYYYFLINNEGILSLQKKTGNQIKDLFPKNDYIHHNYNKENVYKMNIKYNFSSNEIKTYVNEIEIFKINHKSFLNSEIGFMSSNNGTIFTQLLLE